MTFNLAGIPIEGPQAELGRLITENIKYEMAFKQIKALHYMKKSGWCGCGEFSSSCETLRILESMSSLV